LVTAGAGTTGAGVGFTGSAGPTGAGVGVGVGVGGTTTADFNVDVTVMVQVVVHWDSISTNLNEAIYLGPVMPVAIELVWIIVPIETLYWTSSAYKF